jgi:hypothetical protein
MGSTNTKISIQKNKITNSTVVVPPPPPPPVVFVTVWKLADPDPAPPNPPNPADPANPDPAAGLTVEVVDILERLRPPFSIRSSSSSLKKKLDIENHRANPYPLLIQSYLSKRNLT